MSGVSFGFDPAKPGEYPIKRLLIDSDLDGIVCGAMLLKVYPNAEIVTGEATGMQQGKYDRFVDKHTAIADLKYVAGCGLYFDHHIANRPQNANFPGRWRDTDSAARVVYDYFKEAADLSKFAYIVQQVDKFDMGKVTLDEILRPNSVIQLGMSISRDNIEFNEKLVRMISDLPWEDVIKKKAVKALIANVMRNEANARKYIREHTRVVDGVGYIDMRDYTNDARISSFVYTLDLPKSDAVVVFKASAQKPGFNVRLYRNNFNSRAFAYDLLRVAKAMNPKVSGGHKSSCGFTPLPDTEFEQLVIKISSELKKQH